MQLVPVLALGLELGQSGAAEAVVLSLPSVLGLSPIRLNELTLLEPVQNRIEHAVRPFHLAA